MAADASNFLGLAIEAVLLCEGTVATIPPPPEHRLCRAYEFP
jgi:hypothetical protein